MHPKNSYGGSLGSEHAESGGDSPLVMQGAEEDSYYFFYLDTVLNIETR